jgi:hypothetical protein
MLDRFQLRFVACVFGSLMVAAIMALSGRSLGQILLAPLAGIACGMAVSQAVTNHHKLAATATYGEVLAEVEKSRAVKRQADGG